MAARLWAFVLAARLLAAAAAAWTGATYGISIGAAVALGVAVWAAMPAAVLAAALLAAGPGLRSRADTGRLRIWCAEALRLEPVLLEMAAEPLLARLERVEGSEREPTPQVVLVHGIACNRAVWRPLIAALHAAGIARVHAVNLEPLFADIDTHARELLAGLEALGVCAARPVAIVANSMGGLVARAALQQARAGTISRIITIGTPHHGTRIACAFGWRSTRQMCCGSEWLLELNARQEGRFGLPVTSLYSLDDNLIFPAGSGFVRGARSIAVHGLGHLGLLRAPQVLQRIVSELRS